MLALLLKRLGVALAVALAVSIASFSLLHMAGDPAVAIAGEAANSDDIERIRQQYGLDRALPLQYLDWAGRALRGDLGESYFFRQPVAHMLAERLPTTFKLGAAAIVLAVVLAIPLGVVAALHQNSWVDRLALVLAVSGQAMPTFWLSLLLIMGFAVYWPVLPASGSDTWRHFVMPTVVLAYFALPAIMRLTRAGMLEVMQSDYIRTARAKGLRTHEIVLGHALRNALIPVVGLAAVQFGFMLGGSIVVETVFALHGVGYFAWESITRADLPAVQAIILVLSLIYVGLTLVADLASAWLDPRSRVA